MTATNDLISRLSNPAKQDREPQIGTRRSRFWFRNRQKDEEREIRKAQVLVNTNPAAIEPMNQYIVARAEEYKSSLQEVLAPDIKKVQEFLLRVLAPLTIAADIGTSQAEEVLLEATKEAVDPIVLRDFTRMQRACINIRLSRFLVEYFQLDKEDAEQLLNSLAPKQPQQQAVSIFPPLGPAEPPEGYNGPATTRASKKVLPGPDASGEAQEGKRRSRRPG